MTTILSLIGLCFSFTGTILLALSIGPSKNESAGETDEKGAFLPVALMLNRWYFRYGLVLIGIGTLSQIASEVCSLIILK